MFFLPSLPETAEIAAETSSTFPYDAVDQFLTRCSLEWGTEYAGGSDESGCVSFGTAVLFELDDEMRLACALVEAVANDWVALPIDHYRDDAAVILWGGDQKWWGDAEWFPTLAAAQAAYAEFEQRYFDWLDADDDADDDDDETGPFPIGTRVSVDAYSGIAFSVDGYRGGRVVAHMVGDDRRFEFDVDDVSPLDDDVCSCGQIGCGWDAAAE
jgi:hypothetical protein